MSVLVYVNAFLSQLCPLDVLKTSVEYTCPKEFEASSNPVNV